MNQEEYFAGIWQNQRDIKSGKLLAIPFPYPTLSMALPGIMPGRMYVVTAETKVGKTQFTMFSFLYNLLDFAYNHKDQIKVHIIYAALEESALVALDRYLSHLLFKHFGLRISPQKIRGYNKSSLLDEEEIQALNNARIQDKVRFFIDNVEFITDRQVEKILDKCYSHVMTSGSTEVKYERVKDEYTDTYTTNTLFGDYKPNNPNLWNFCIIDHIGCVEAKNGDLKGEIDKLGQGLIRLRNVYNMSSIIIQQQSSVGITEVKRPEDARRLLASKDRLADSRYSAQNADYVIGISSPYRLLKHLPLEFQIWDRRYNVGRLKNCLSVVELLLSRHGPCFTPFPLFFDGATCTFEEMPIFDGIDDITHEEELEERTRYAEKLQSLCR